MLTSVVIENFKKHKKLSVGLKNGVNVIIGPNYTGKSSVLEAIAYAFGGPKFVRGGAQVIAQDSGEPTKVVVNFETGGKGYVITRGSNTTSLVSDDGDLATGVTAVNEMLDEVVGSDRQLFNILRYSRQNEAALLLTEGEAKLTRMLESLTGSDILDRVLHSLKSDRDGLSSKMEDLDIQSVSEDEIDSLSKNVDSMKRKIVEAEEMLSEVSSAKDSLNSEYKKLSADLSELIETEKKVQSLVAEKSGLRERLKVVEESLQNSKDRLDSMESPLDSSKLSELEDKMKSLSAELRQAKDSVAYRDRLTDSISRLKKSIERQKLFVSDNEKGLLELDSAAAELTEASKYDSLHKKRVGIEATLDRLKKKERDGVCPECLRPLDDADLNLDELRADISRVESELESVKVLEKVAELQNRKLAKIGTDKAKLHGILSRDRCNLKGLIDELADASNSLSELVVPSQDAIDELESEVSSINETLGKQNKVAKEYRRAEREVERLSIALDDSVKCLAAVEEKMNLLKIEGGMSVEDLKAKLDEVSSKLEKASDNEASVLSKVGVMKVDLEAMTSKLKLLLSAKSKIDEITAQLDKVSRLEKFLRSNRAAVMDNTWKAIMAGASSVVSMITGGVIDEVTRDSENGIRFYENGAMRPVAAASGCQQAVIGVSIRATISKMFSTGMRFLMLDEITADMDEDHAAATMAIVRELSDQVIFITHRSADISDDYNTIELE